MKIKHKETKLEWMIIGIDFIDKKYSYNVDIFEVQKIEETIGKYKDIKLKKEKFEKDNKDKKFYIPEYINIDNKNNSYIIDEELELKANQVKFVRDGLLEKQDYICPLCNKIIDTPTLDHFHSKRHNGDGLVRGVLCNTCNRMIGVIENKALMNRISFSDLPEFLKSVSEYVQKIHYPIIHPSEIHKEKKLSKRNFNKLKRLYEKEEFIPIRKNQKKKEFPEFPKSGKLTKQLKDLFDQFNINPYN